MTDPRPDYLGRATDEIKGMATDGFAHPATKKVLTGAAAGAVAAIFLPILTIPVGLVGGAGYALWRRIKR